MAAHLSLKGHVGLLELLADHVLQQSHHDRPVVLRVLLSPVQIVLVRRHLRSFRNEHREVTVDQALVVREFLCNTDVVLGQLLADVSGAGVQHQPDRI